MANIDINQNVPFTTNQISNSKPNIPKTENVLSGYIAGSFNGGHNKTIAYKKVMAGEKHKEYKIAMNIQMLTPKTVSFQKLKCTLRAYFVPNSRVWTNAEKYTAQKGGSGEIKIKEIPNLGGKYFPTMSAGIAGATAYTSIQNSTLWRDSWISAYIPRLHDFSYRYQPQGVQGVEQSFITPKISVLPLRGRIAIYNDLERNKEYDQEILEYKDDTVSDEEWQSYNPINNLTIANNFMRSRRENSYYTDYRTDIQGFELEKPTNDITSSLIDWSAWESKISESRAQAENAQKTDWQIIAELRGSKILTEGKVQLIGKKTFDMNYSAITQSTYNTNENISEEFQVMGKQGGYSYTYIEMPLYAGVEFIEEGYIHIIATVTADSVFESGIDRNLLNVTPLEEYRPDLLDDKFDVLKKIEIDGSVINTNNLEEVIGFKRKFTEIFKLPNVIQGDLTSNNYYDTNGNTESFNVNNQVITQKTYQFFENNAYTQKELSTEGTIDVNKHIWKDYTDLLINKNQAIQNKVTGYIAADNIPGSSPRQRDITVDGQNQIFYVGMCQCLCILPVDQSIKENYTQWGEH